MPSQLGSPVAEEAMAGATQLAFEGRDGPVDTGCDGSTRPATSTPNSRPPARTPQTQSPSPPSTETPQAQPSPHPRPLKTVPEPSATPSRPATQTGTKDRPGPLDSNIGTARTSDGRFEGYDISLCSGTPRKIRITVNVLAGTLSVPADGLASFAFKPETVEKATIEKLKTHNSSRILTVLFEDGRKETFLFEKDSERAGSVYARCFYVWVLRLAQA